MKCGDKLYSYGDFETFVHDNNSTVFRYWVYKRMFTPLEQDKKYEDQDEFVSIYAERARIAEIIKLPDGDYLIGFVEDIDDDTDTNEYIEYYKLSEIHLARSSRDQE